ncbi:Hpt domain-containing protein, partial [Acinetobacter baumannii]
IGERSRVPAAGQTLASDDLPPLPGVDLSAGLQATGGKPAFYRKLLLSFRDSHGGDPGRIGQALEAGDCVTARRLAHTLKSVAG